MSQHQHKKWLSIRLASNAFLFLSFLVCVFLVTSSFSMHEDGNEVSSLSNPQLNGYFIQEEIPGKFKQLKAVFGDEEIILREDRIEIFERSRGQEVSSYLLFDNSRSAKLIGVNPIDVTSKPIANAAMAKVLGASTMVVTTFEKVKYQNLYDDVDLVLTIAEGGIHAEVEADNKQAASLFGMTMLSDSNVTNEKNSNVSFQNKQSNSEMRIASKSSTINLKSNKLSFSESSDAPENLNFDIVLK